MDGRIANVCAINLANLYYILILGVCPTHRNYFMEPVKHALESDAKLFIRTGSADSLRMRSSGRNPSESIIRKHEETDCPHRANLAR